MKKNFNIDGINFRSVSVQHGNINSKAFIINGKLLNHKIPLKDLKGFGFSLNDILYKYKLSDIKEASRLYTIEDLIKEIGETDNYADLFKIYRFNGLTKIFDKIAYTEDLRNWFNRLSTHKAIKKGKIFCENIKKYNTQVYDFYRAIDPPLGRIINNYPCPPVRYKFTFI